MKTPATKDYESLDHFTIGDQPTTCPECGTRTQFEPIDPDPEDGTPREYHVCPSCGEEFVMCEDNDNDYDYDEEEEDE
jgi:ribosomal protein S27AE